MEAYALTDVGMVRSINQDYVYTSLEPIGKLPNLFIVADGMGGHKAGDLASKFTVETFVELVKKSKGDGPISIIKNAVHDVNQLLIEKSKESTDYDGMGTTLVVATIIGKSLYIANVGDSRLYIMDDELCQITRDHSYVEELVDSGILSRDDEDYKKNKNRITRAIGAGFELMADFFEIRITEGNIILMCSDGLTGMVSDENIQKVLKGNDSLKSKAARLIAAAKTGGGRDNIGVVLVKP